MITTYDRACGVVLGVWRVFLDSCKLRHSEAVLWKRDIHMHIEDD
jgi:hypothetical protein